MRGVLATRTAGVCADLVEETLGRSCEAQGLINETVIVFGCVYIYHGTLVEVWPDELVLENAVIVYETGEFSGAYSDFQRTGIERTAIRFDAIESYGKASEAPQGE